MLGDAAIWSYLLSSPAPSIFFSLTRAAYVAQKKKPTQNQTIKKQTKKTHPKTKKAPTQNTQTTKTNKPQQ